jgi:catechol 2,3-dioxygenase-like lactoylglutathione lyase family enzyme
MGAAVEVEELDLHADHPSPVAKRRVSSSLAVVTSTCSCCGESVEATVQLHSHKEIRICYRCLDWLNWRREKQIKAHGGGWRAVAFDPIFRVADVSRSTDHYARMGFEISHHDESYAFAHRERDLTIHLALAEGESPGTGSLYIHCEDADQFADEWRKAGLVIIGPDDFDHGKREGSHTDPDGNLIRFGSPLQRAEADTSTDQTTY